jgi:hypothetical protein
MACEDGVPIFVISFNRGSVLKRVIKNYRNLRGVGDIIVHDNGSFDPKTLEILYELERDGVIVYRRPAILKADDLNNTNTSVEEYFLQKKFRSNYVVSDCDIDMSISEPEALLVYGELLATHPRAMVVGPMLRIADIPPSLPLFNEVMNRHIRQFWHKKPQWTETSFGPIAFIDSAIDTTFALHRANEPFRRLKDGLRVYYPYEAWHLDWYDEPSDGDAYHASSSSGVAHWNNAAFLRSHSFSKLRYKNFNIVVKDENGNLVSRKHTVNSETKTGLTFLFRIKTWKIFRWANGID